MNIESHTHYLEKYVRKLILILRINLSAGILVGMLVFNYIYKEHNNNATSDPAPVTLFLQRLKFAILVWTLNQR